MIRRTPSSLLSYVSVIGFILSKTAAKALKGSVSIWKTIFAGGKVASSEESCSYCRLRDVGMR